MKLLPILALWVGQALAAPFAVQLGDTRVALDAPPGFSDVQATGSPKLLDLAESLTSASNRILLFALEDGDVRRFNVGDTPELRRYSIVITPRGLERERLSPEAFKTFVADSLRELGALPDAKQKLRTYLDAQPRGRPSLLAELRRDSGVVSILNGARLPDRERMPPRYLLASTTLLLVRGKALNMGVYTAYDDDADLEWIRATTLRWIDELRRLNASR